MGHGCKMVAARAQFPVIVVVSGGPIGMRCFRIDEVGVRLAVPAHNKGFGFRLGVECRPPIAQKYNPNRQ